MSHARRLLWASVIVITCGFVVAGMGEAPARGGAGAVATDWRTLVGGPGPESVPVREFEGETVVGANDLARLLDATKFWRGDIRKLVLRSGAHRIQFAVDNPFVVIDNKTVRLPAPVRSLAGELQGPVACVDSLPRDSTLSRLLFDPTRRVVWRVPPSGIVGTPRLSAEPGMTRLVFSVDRPEEVVVASRARDHFRVRFSGFFAGTLPSTFPAASLVRAIRTIATAGGSAFEIQLASAAAGFRLVRDPSARRVELVFERDAKAGSEAFAPEDLPGPRPIRVVVIDPGHGGIDVGVKVAGATEKHLTLALARRLKAEIEQRMSAQVVLTREDDRMLTVQQRAEAANRARADIVVSLHFDGFGNPAARGVTAYCPPATFSAGTKAQEAQSRAELSVLPWRDVAIRHAVRSRELSEHLLSSIELRSLGPIRLREILPYSLLGVNAPGLMLECATLTSSVDRARVSREQGLADLAATIADGILAYQQNQ